MLCIAVPKSGITTFWYSYVLTCLYSCFMSTVLHTRISLACHPTIWLASTVCRARRRRRRVGRFHATTGLHVVYQADTHRVYIYNCTCLHLNIEYLEVGLLCDTSWWRKKEVKTDLFLFLTLRINTTNLRHNKITFYEHHKKRKTWAQENI